MINTDILYLTHVTNIENINNIIKFKKLLTDHERHVNNVIFKGTGGGLQYDDDTYEINKHQFPGLYLGYVTKYPKKNFINFYGGDIMFVFGPELLQQKNYHLNLIDNNGRISESLTYFPHNINNVPKLNKVIKFYIKKYDRYPGNEIVFHNGISLNLVVEIWVKDSNIYEKLKKIFTKHKLLEYIGKIKLIDRFSSTYPNYKIKTHTNKLKYLDKKNLPFVTYYLDNGGTGSFDVYYPYKKKTNQV